MDLNSFQCDWAVRKSGYEWEDRDEGRCLVPVDCNVDTATGNVSHPLLGEVRSYRPLREQTGLFLEFGKLPAKEDAILAFANRYGGLGVDEWIHGRESFNAWKYEIGAMRKAVKLWKEKSRDALSRVLAKSFVGDFSFSVQSRRGGLSLGVELKSLKAAMWAQLSMAAVGDKDFTECQVCGKPFEVSPETARSHRMYCGNTCKIRSYRHRQKRAKEMRAAGQNLRKIAKELGSDVATVKGWVSE